MYRPFLLPVGLIALLLFSPALAAEPSTPLDPFHDISKLAQRPPEPPICCLKPLPSSEPVEEILSFEDWKMKQEQALLQQQQEQAEGAKPRDSATKANAHSTSPDAQYEAQYEAGTADGPPPLEPPAPPPPHFRVPLTDRFNYANLDCSARVHYAHRSARSSASLLSSKKDRYMLSPCNTPGEDKFVVVELCEDIRIDTVQLANFEFFSGVFKDFSVSVARTYTTDPDGWTPAGTYRAKNIRGIQSFHPPTSLRDFYRFIRIDFHSHYGSEFYCPVSLLRVYGLTHLEQWKWEVWEAEYQAKNADAAMRSIAAGSAPVAEDFARVVKGSLSGEEPISAVSESPAKPDSSPSETADTTVSPTKTTESVPTEASFTSVLSESVTMEPSIVNEVPNPTEEHSQSSQFENSHIDASPISSRVGNSDVPTSPDSSPLPSSSYTQSQSSPQPPASGSIVHNDSSTGSQGSDPSFSDSNSKLNVETSPLVTTSPVPTIIPHESRSVPAVAATGESIYRTIMTRLSLLEGNSTLYLRYVEEQTRSLRDALTRLEEDVGRLEGMGKAQTQSFQKIINELDRQRRRLEREHGELQTRVDYLTDEVILEKRLGIAQLCLLLTVLVFMALTRGSRGEPFIAQMSNGRRDSLREWGRRHLSSFGSGEWASKLRTGSPTPIPVDFVKSPIPVKKADKVRFPTERPREDVDRTPHRSSNNLASPLSSKGRSPAEIRAPHPRQFVAHRPRTPTSASLSVYTHAPRSSGFLGAYSSPNPPGSAQGSGRPRLRRVSSHNTPALVAHSISVGEGIAATPLSAKKWAKSAHLHEIRKAGPKPSSDAPSQTVSISTTDTSTVQMRYVSGNLEDAKHVDGDTKQFWRSATPDPITRGRERERSRDGRRDLGSREPLSVSSLQNRSRAQDGADLDRLRLASSCQPNGGPPRIIDLDTESESWVDTDVEGSEVEDRSP